MKLQTLRLWHDATPRSGAMNMALDEVMLQAAQEPWLRVYQWAEPTVSIGFSQPLGAIPEPKRRWPVVRRWTGGGVVEHDGDWTYTLAIPGGHPANRERAPELYCHIHEAMIAALAQCGISDCELQSASTSDGMGVCFNEPARFDIVRRGTKIAGAAQRRAAAGLLHQGSVQFLRPPPDFAVHFANALSASVTIVSQAGAEAGLVEAAVILAQNKYGTPEWLDHRTAGPRSPSGPRREFLPLIIFVYGSLKRGCCNARHLDGQRFIGEARTRPIYRLADLGGYPGMFPVAQGGVSIRGEVWEVDEACRARLDELEDVAHGVYVFENVELLPSFEAQPVKTYLYRLDVSSCPDAGDDWRE